ADLLIEVLDRIEREVLPARRAEIDVAPGGLEADRLRPDLVLALRQRRKVVSARVIGIDRRGGERSFGLGRHGGTTHLLARGRCDRAAEQDIGGVGRAWSGGRQSGGNHRGKTRDTVGVSGSGVVHGMVSLRTFQRGAGCGAATVFRYAMTASTCCGSK